MRRSRILLLCAVAAAAALTIWQATGDRPLGQANRIVEETIAEIDARDTPAPPPLLARALVANEDPGFFNRPAWRSPLLNTIARMRVVEHRGARRHPTLGDHLKTILTAIGLDLALTHDELVQASLGWVYFGNGCDGAAAASDGYFATPLAEATDAQLLALASFPRNPSRLPSDPAMRGARVALMIERMQDTGTIDAAEAGRLASLPLADISDHRTCD